MIKNWLPANWPAPENIHAGTTLRTGGVSGEQYSSLNLATHVGDDAVSVATNRQRMMQQIALPSEPIWLQQIHGQQVVLAETAKNTPVADASYSFAQNSVCTVLTADCLPVLVCATDGSCVAAIHAGWRGLLAGIIENTTRKMQGDHLMVWLGPAIGVNCFSVGNDVRSAYLAKMPEFAPAFRPVTTNKWLTDIYQLAKITLYKLGIKQIYGGEYCTVTDHQRFFSYRRDGETGRMASLIWRE